MIRCEKYPNNYITLKELKEMLLDMDINLSWISGMPLNIWVDIVKGLNIEATYTSDSLKVLVNDITITKLYNKLKGIDLV